LSWLHFVFLAAITVLPFPRRLLAEFFTLRTAFLLYWLNIAFAGASVLACWIYTERAGLVRADAPQGVSHATWRRIVIAQLLDALGAALGYFSIPLGIAFIVAVQLNYAIAPRLPVLSKL